LFSLEGEAVIGVFFLTITVFETISLLLDSVLSPSLSRVGCLSLLSTSLFLVAGRGCGLRSRTFLFGS
jgi:hypothetical protein